MFQEVGNDVQIFLRTEAGDIIGRLGRSNFIVQIGDRIPALRASGNAGGGRQPCVTDEQTVRVDRAAMPSQPGRGIHCAVRTLWISGMAHATCRIEVGLSPLGLVFGVVGLRNAQAIQAFGRAAATVCWSIFG